jgi:TPR repeat protein
VGLLLSPILAALLSLLLMALPGAAQSRAAQPNDTAALIQAARLGKATAQFELGALFLDLDGNSPNHKEALRWLRAAAEQGHPAATYYLGFMHDSGLGLPENRSEARRLYLRAGELGSAEAQSLLSNLAWIEGDQQQSLNWLRKAAAQGHLNSLYGLATIHEEGLAGLINPDSNMALQWYRAAAERGHTGARLLLAERYELGTSGLQRDPATAQNWYLRVAQETEGEEGATAREKVGRAFLYGIGATQNYEAARYWLQKAQTPGAQRELGYIYQEGLGVHKNPQIARHWYEKAAAAGDSIARQSAQRLPTHHEPQ